LKLGKVVGTCHVACVRLWFDRNCDLRDKSTEKCGKRLLQTALAVLLPFVVCAQPTAFNDNIDRTDPNFVKASLLVFGPGNELYACAGHVAFRLECQAFKLDYVFSYEGESATDQIWKFLSGRLKMGMFAIPTQEFLKQYEETSRGCKQYQLDLSPAAKVRLWKLFDDLVAKGADLPYDYIKRGCAQSTLNTLLSAIRPERIDSGVWPEKFRHSRRELLHSYIADSPWTCLLLHMISGPEADFAPNVVDKIITPDDMLDYLHRMRVEGRPILTAAPVELLPQSLNRDERLVSPMMVASFLVVLAITGFFCFSAAISGVFLVLQTVIGLVESYIVFCSDLPASSWNWLLIPFNPLPLVFWKWRKHWALPFAGVLLAWVTGMLLSPHRLTDPAFYVLAMAYVIWYVGVWRQNAVGLLVKGVKK